jgi:predicted MPP superfamily phosphohydrolase
VIPHNTRRAPPLRSPGLTTDEACALKLLEARAGQLHVRQRLGIERDFEANVLRKGRHFFHVDNWNSLHGLIRGGLRLVGLHARGRRNALAIEVRNHDVALAHLPAVFDGFTLLQLSDLHIDMAAAFVDALIERVRPLRYDVCVLTGDYRARTYGPFDAALAGLQRLRPHIMGTPYAVLGNHDTIRMVPAMEAMGYQVLLNESVRIERGEAAIHLVGVDDAHFYRLENFERATDGIPDGGVTVLLSHTPELYRHAAHSNIDVMLSGHTHGGQICLPGGWPLRTSTRSPRRFVRGSWRYNDMVGYTSVGAGTSIVDVRLNCPPEITLHRLLRSGQPSERTGDAVR